MGRRESPKTNYYCPACRRKTLIKTSKYNHSTHGYQRGFLCTNRPPKVWAKLIAALESGDPERLENSNIYVSYIARHQINRAGGAWAGGEAARSEARQVEQAKAKAFPAPCATEIFHPDRDAEIVDFYGVLDLLIRPGDLIIHHLLEKNPKIQRKGIEVLYSSEDVDLVRLRDNGGVAVWLYWRCTWDPDRLQSEIKWEALGHEAAASIKHDGVSVRTIFSNQTRSAVWAATESRNVPFSGTLGVRKRAALVEWVMRLEANLETYTAAAIKNEIKWRAWGSQLKDGLRSRSDEVRVLSFNGESQLATVSIRCMVTQEQAIAIADILSQTSDHSEARGDRGRIE